MNGKLEGGPAQRIGIDTGSGEGVLWVFSALWYGGLVAFVRVGGRDSLPMLGLCGLGGRVPLAMARAAGRARGRYGRAGLEVGGPAAPGGRLGGVVHLPHPLADAHLRLTLKCRRR